MKNEEIKKQTVHTINWMKDLKNNNNNNKIEANLMESSEQVTAAMKNEEKEKCVFYVANEKELYV